MLIMRCYGFSSFLNVLRVVVRERYAYNQVV